jgi:hypothetical protein
MSKEAIVLTWVVLLAILEFSMQGSKGLHIDEYLLGVVISQAGTFMWIINYSILSTEYYKE